MEVEEWIKGEIRSHMEKHGINATESQIWSMTEAALGGCLAFSIIYAFSERAWDEPGPHMEMETFNRLDHTQVLCRPGTDGFSRVYSYDGGKRYQWFEPETLLLDPARIREIKLGQVLG